jgi:hypothetical protein
MTRNDIESQTVPLTTVAKVAIVTIGWVGSLIGTAWWMGSENAQLQGKVLVLQSQVGDHEQRLRALEPIASDVRWIRQQMERQSGRP